MTATFAAFGCLACISISGLTVEPRPSPLPRGIAPADTVVLKPGDLQLVDCGRLTSSTARYRVDATPSEPPGATRLSGTLTYSWTVGPDQVVETATRRTPYLASVITVVIKAG